ncbi:MAG: glutamate-cysteine ligase family protein [Pseudomonadota bacterium]
MGREIDQVDFAEADYRAFSACLERDLVDLESLLHKPDFGHGDATVGAELEIYVVDSQGHPLSLNEEIKRAANDPRVTVELNRYNLEYNLAPAVLAKGGMQALEQDILDSLQHLRSVAAPMGARIVPIGILPTLREGDFGSHCITDRSRFHALVKQLLKRRGGKFRVDIDGRDPLQMELEDITLEGANTSFQVHYLVQPEEFADTFNAVQLVTPLALALAANSPTLFGHRLWQETRVPLFKQSIDTRHRDPYGWREPARVNFGQGWVRRGALELFREVVRIYPPLLPVCENTEASALSRHDNAPALSELRLHQSTVWLWNRPVYDDVDGGHLRIEMRALPAGPTAADMVANAAFLIGAAEGIRPQLEALLPALPFSLAEYNFYRAAQHGLDARLMWPSVNQTGYREHGIIDVIAQVLPLAQEGLRRIGVSASESDHYLGIIENRLRKKQSGSIWQLKKLRQLRQTETRDAAQHEMLEAFMRHSEANLPVAEWPL